MFIHAYLRASTNDQDVNRARASLDAFADERGHRIAGYYAENITGTKIDRPELNRLIQDAREGDVILLEGIDRLTRLTEKDWTSLKSRINAKGLFIVSMDLQTSWSALDGEQEGFTGQMLRAVNSMLLEMLAAISRKDYEDRRRRQAEGIKRKKERSPDSYKGKQADRARHAKVLELKSAGLSLTKIQEHTGYSRSQVCRIIKEYK